MATVPKHGALARMKRPLISNTGLFAQSLVELAVSSKIKPSPLPSEWPAHIEVRSVAQHVVARAGQFVSDGLLGHHRVRFS